MDSKKMKALLEEFEYLEIHENYCAQDLLWMIFMDLERLFNPNSEHCLLYDIECKLFKHILTDTEKIKTGTGGIVYVLRKKDLNEEELSNGIEVYNFLYDYYNL